VISDAEAARLDAMTPAVNATVARIARSVDASENSSSELNETLKQMLKNEFGDTWKKYVVVTVESKTTDLEDQKLVAQTPTEFADPETLEPVAGNQVSPAARAADGIRESALGFGYYMKATHEYWTWWWGYSNNANTDFLIKVNGTTTTVPADLVYAKVVDKGGTVTQSRAYATHVEAEGNFVYAMFYGKEACSTYHRAKLSTVDNNGAALTLDSGTIKYTW